MWQFEGLPIISRWLRVLPKPSTAYFQYRGWPTPNCLLVLLRSYG